MVGRQPLIRGVCHVTPSGNGKSWRGAAGSGSSAGPWPGSRGHWEARAMVRAREAPASSATASTMLGTAVFRAAFLESPHQSNTGLQKAQSMGGEKEMRGSCWASHSPCDNTGQTSHVRAAPGSWGNTRVKRVPGFTPGATRTPQGYTHSNRSQATKPGSHLKAHENSGPSLRTASHSTRDNRDCQRDRG